MSDQAVTIATFSRSWDAEVARQYLSSLGIEAWVDPAPDEGPYREVVPGSVRLLVPPEDAPEAADALADMADDEPLVDPKARSRKIWVAAIAALVAVSMFVTAAPAVLWPPVLLIAIALFLIWRAAGPRRP